MTHRGPFCDSVILCLHNYRSVRVPFLEQATKSHLLITQQEQCMQEAFVHLAVCCCVNGQMETRHRIASLCPGRCRGQGKIQSECTAAATQMLTPSNTESLLCTYNNLISSHALCRSACLLVNRNNNSDYNLYTPHFHTNSPVNISLV